MIVDALIHRSVSMFGFAAQGYDSLFAESWIFAFGNCVKKNSFIGRANHRVGAHRSKAFIHAPAKSAADLAGCGRDTGIVRPRRTLGLPLMVAIIGGETRAISPLVDIYREYGRVRDMASTAQVGVHAWGTSPKRRNMRL